MKSKSKMFLFFLAGPLLFSGAWLYFQFVPDNEEEESVYLFSTQEPKPSETKEKDVEEYSSMGQSEVVALSQAQTLMDIAKQETIVSLSSSSMAAIRYSAVSKVETVFPSDSLFQSLNDFEKSKDTLASEKPYFQYVMPVFDANFQENANLLAEVQLLLYSKDPNFPLWAPKWQKELKAVALNIFYFTAKYQMALPDMRLRLLKTFQLILPKGSLVDLKITKLNLRLSKNDPESTP